MRPSALSAAANVEPCGVRPLDQRWLQTNIPCQAACPVGTHAGGYVSLISQGHYEEAYHLARRPNPFASICGRICAHPCEAACRRQYIDSPVNIRVLKRFVTERYGVESNRSFDEIRNHVEVPRPPAESPGKVAIIGAGPAGLSCAHDLALMGHQVVVFEAAPVAGGMLRLGIPEYRLPRELIQAEIEFIRYLGVEIRTGVEIGTDVEFADLRRDFGAVFVGAGCRKGRSLALPGADLDGVLTAVDFLAAANLGHPLKIGDHVLVVGGGNVAFDVARTASRFGGTSVPGEPHHNLALDAARVALRSYRRQVTLMSLEAPEELPADPEEIVESANEGITLVHRRGPHAVLGDNGSVRALQTRDVSRVFDEDGRFAPEFVEGSESELACDTVILAVGQVADLSFLGPGHGIDTTPQNTIQADRETLATSVPGIFAGGDVVFGPRIAIEAVADGRRAALSIDTHLTGRVDPDTTVLAVRRFESHGYEHPFAGGDYEQQPRGELPMLPVVERTAAATVELSLNESQARAEGARCLHCWINTIFDSRAIDASECIQCGGCVDVCPEHCIDLVGIMRLASSAGDEPLMMLPDGQPIELAAGARGAALIKDETACIRCGLCARRCPVGCVTMQGFYRPDEMDILALCEQSL